MHINNTVDAGISIVAQSRQRSEEHGSSEVDFDQILTDRIGNQKAVSSGKALPSDWKRLAEGVSRAGVSNLFDAFGVYIGSTMTDEVRQEIQNDYISRLPVFDGERFTPPVDDYYLILEDRRLEEVEAMVVQMDEAGEIDKVLDAIIGIHGLKDKMTRKNRVEMKQKLIELTKASLLENQWASAYKGSLKNRIDLSFTALSTFLINDGDKLRTRPMSSSLPEGDPGLMGFIEDPKWQEQIAGTW